MMSHLLAVFLAALAMFALGSVWYSPLLFARRWMQESGIDPDKKPEGREMARMFGLTFLLLLIAAAVLDCVLTSWAVGEGMSHGLSVGFLGGTLVAAATGITFLFEKRSPIYFLINAGYDMLGFCIMGVVLSLF